MWVEVESSDLILKITPPFSDPKSQSSAPKGRTEVVKEGLTFFNPCHIMQGLGAKVIGKSPLLL